MSLLTVNDLKMSFAHRDVLTDVSFEVAKNDRIGLIGRNGSGKTTLFKILTGEHEPTGGSFYFARGTQVGFVEQHACRDSNRTVYEEMLSVFDFLAEMEVQLEEVHEALDRADGNTDALIAKQAQLTEEYQNKGGLTYKNRARSCLVGLGFPESEHTLPVTALSGGQRTKLSLGKLLLSEPQLLLLDEPTNHLDIASVEWLEEYMLKYKGAAIIISHDRYFLDRVTDRTIEIVNGTARCGKGGYSLYMKLKAETLESQRREYERISKEIERIEGIIVQQKQFNQKRNYITIASKEKEIEHLRAQLPEMPPKQSELKLRLTASCRTGDEVLMAKGLKKSFGAHTLFEDVSMNIYREDRVFLLGPNGCGKTTLLRVLTGRMPHDAGYAYFGANVKIGYFDQNQTGLHSDRTVLMEIYERFPQLTVSEIRGYLGVFLFKGDEIEKKMSELSGGERARVALLLLILSKPNLLILDEPTNHLDIQSREVFEEALAEYDGTILAVSHDRYFVNRIANKIMAFNGTSVTP
ncbi:MAG: ABC-F family ATP-binding cassette domain-containing protein, partial [Clostridia bacterium]|nr:ABC-F family ATP-binding cassette domain-containing protein [Clostridia bacterium]